MSADAHNRVINLKGRRFYNSDSSPSRIHAKASTLVSGRSASFFSIQFESFSVSFVSRARELFVMYVTA